MTSREQFEAWAIDHFAAPDFDRIGDRYKKQWMQHAWSGWQASRTALVVELPDTVANTGTLTSAAVIGYKRECREVLEAAGVRVEQ